MRALRIDALCIAFSRKLRIAGSVRKSDTGIQWE